MRECVVEIRDRSLIYLELDRHGKKKKLVRSEMFVSERSFLQQSRNDVVAYARMLMKKHKIHPRNLAVVINNRHVLTRRLEVPKVSTTKRQRQIIRNEMINELKLGTDFVIDYDLIAEKMNGNTKMLSVLVTAIPRLYMEQLTYVLKKLRIKPRAVVSSASSMFQYFERRKIIDEDGTICIVELENRYMRFFMYRDKEFRLTRSSFEGIEANPVERLVTLTNRLSGMSVDRFNEPIRKLIIIGHAYQVNYILQRIDDPQKTISMFPHDPNLIGDVDDFISAANCLGVI